MPPGRPRVTERVRAIGTLYGTRAELLELRRRASEAGHRSISAYLRNVLGL